MSVLAITSFELVTSTTRITGNHKLYLQALYVADAGVEDTLCVLSKADWSGLDFETPDESTLSTLSLDTIDANWSWDGVNTWSLSNSDLDNPYNVTLTMKAGDAGDPSDDRLLLESMGTVTFGTNNFYKTIVAEIAEHPSKKITLWMEKEI
jgi:Tfp pilus assembly protein PilX